MVKKLFFMVFFITLGLTICCFGENSDFYGDYIFTFETGDPVCEQTVDIYTIGNDQDRYNETYIYLPETDPYHNYSYVKTNGDHITVATTVLGTTLTYAENIIYYDSGYTRSREMSIDFSDNFNSAGGKGTCVTDDAFACSGPITLNGTHIDWNVTYDISGSWRIYLDTTNETDDPLNDNGKTDIKYWTISQADGVLTLEAGDTRGAGTITGPQVSFKYFTSSGTVYGSGIVVSGNSIRGGTLDMPSKEIQTWSADRMKGDDGGDDGTGCFIGLLF